MNGRMTAAFLICALMVSGPVFAEEKPKKSGASGGLAYTWARNCARCHLLRSPDTYSDAQWEVALLHHTVRTWVSLNQAQDILKFLKAAN